MRGFKGFSKGLTGKTLKSFPEYTFKNGLKGFPYISGSDIANHDFSYQYQRVISHALASGIPVPPQDVLIEDDNLVRASVADGSWDDYDLVYYSRRRAAYREYAKLNWKSPGSFSLLEVGTLTFDDDGFTGDGATGYLRTQYIPSVNGVNYTLNNASVQVYSTTDINLTDVLFGCNAASNARRLTFFPRNASSSTASAIINGTTSDSFVNIFSAGFFHVKRTASNVVAVWQDGVVRDTGTNASTALPDLEVYFLAQNNNGTPTSFAARNFGMGMLGASQNGREVAINENWNPLFIDQSLGFTPGTKYWLGMDGQSNSEGITLVEDLPENLRRRFNNVYIWYNPTETTTGGKWQKLQAGVNNQRGSRLQYYGAEIAIADLFETYHPNDVLYISKYAVGSTKVAVDAGGVDWNSTSTGECLDVALNSFHSVTRASISGGFTDLGVIWDQGEHDALTDLDSATATFVSNTAATLDEMRTVLSAASMPIYICRLNANISRNATRLANVRTAQGTTAGNLCDPGTYPNNHMIDKDSYVLIDAVHNEQLAFGEDMYWVLFP